MSALQRDNVESTIEPNLLRQLPCRRCCPTFKPETCAEVIYELNCVYKAALLLLQAYQGDSQLAIQSYRATHQIPYQLILEQCADDCSLKQEWLGGELIKAAR